MPEHQHAPLWKQLLGAATGAIVALLLYGGFAVASPNLSLLTAYLTMPAHPRSPRTIRDEAIAWREELGDRARAATARLQKGEPYFGRSEASSASSTPSVVPPPSVTKEKAEAPKEQRVSPEGGREKKPADPKHKEEKLPDTGIPLWLIGGVAFGLAMAIRYRKELLCSPSPRGPPG